MRKLNEITLKVPGYNPTRKSTFYLNFSIPELTEQLEHLELQGLGLS